LVDLLHHHGCEAEGQLVADQELRVAHQGAPDRHHLLLPTGKRGGGMSAPLLQSGEEAVDRVELPGTGALHVPAHHEIFLGREAGKQPPALGHQRDPAPDDPAGRKTADRLSGELDRFPRRPQQAADSLEESGLARAVRADERRDFAALDLEIHAEQHLGIAVIRIELPGGEEIHGQAASPMYTRCTNGSPITAAGAPSAILRPASSTSSRPAAASSACTTCSIQSMVTPVRWMRRISSTSSIASCSVSPPAISSRRSSRGPVASARASSRRLRSSKVRVPASRFAFESRPVSPRTCTALP